MRHHQLRIGDVVRVQEIDMETGEMLTYLGRIHRILYDHSLGMYWITRILLEDGSDIFPDMILANVTRQSQKRCAALRIWRTWVRCRDRANAKFERALRLLQTHCKAWNASPNNPAHVARMQSMAKLHGMR